MEDFIFYLSHIKVILSRGTHQKSLVRGLGTYLPKKPNFLVSPDLSSEPPASRNSRPDSREPYQICLVRQTSLVWEPASRGFLPASRNPHRTCLVVGSDLSGVWPASKNFYQPLERSTRLVRWPHRTCPVKDSPNGPFEVGAINRPPPSLLGHWPLRKSETPLWDPKLEHLFLSLRLQSWFLFLREDSSSLECVTFKLEHLTLSLDDLIVFVTLGDSIP
jgi:hypothetical protein